MNNGMRDRSIIQAGPVGEARSSARRDDGHIRAPAFIHCNDELACCAGIANAIALELIVVLPALVWWWL